MLQISIAEGLISQFWAVYEGKTNMDFLLIHILDEIKNQNLEALK